MSFIPAVILGVTSAVVLLWGALTLIVATTKMVAWRGALGFIGGGLGILISLHLAEVTAALLSSVQFLREWNAPTDTPLLISFAIGAGTVIILGMATRTAFATAAHGVANLTLLSNRDTEVVSARQRHVHQANLRRRRGH